MDNIYNKLKKLREESGLRQGQIADYLGVTQTYISKVETGERNLTVDQLERLISLYGYSLQMFVDENNQTQPVRFAFRAQEITEDDLKVIADIGRIAINCRFMKRILEEADD